ncbi:hypothetical protein LTS16_016798 [Friedmanniomyces endolithicus]|nr:hypothetical protein LTR94_014288 [Friedmanniomyces endolithicus]KAK0777206.1 hypothetical protein LTR59_013931 [Friedmanniomyces endolithicus]KAK0797346.1 hypothetical protein LTR38_008249 [Friedmanniomyces endolithicus]KAK0813956.1 hypothetical protein LTR75_004411 [Friedmanniomyces endolithicus]KAK0866659.1 hypothetical protein LTS02_004622 [Friedmanniomyces endolithicus]
MYEDLYHLHLLRRRQLGRTISIQATQVSSKQYHYRRTESMAPGDASSPLPPTSGDGRDKDAQSAVLHNAGADQPMPSPESEDEDLSMADAKMILEHEEEEIVTGSAKVNNDQISGTLGVEFGDIQSDGDEWHESIEASITFRLDGGAKMQRVGGFDLHIIDKEFGDPAYPKPWVAELLQSQAFHGDLAFVCSALRTLYDSDGAVIADFAEVADELETETVVYVSMIRLEPEWRGMGLGSAAMSVLHQMLPSHCSGDITMLLQPDMLTEPGNTEEMRMGIQESLMRFYTACGYTLWHQEDEELPCYLLMGRKIEAEGEDGDEDEAAEEDDSSVDSRIVGEMKIS